MTARIHCDVPDCKNKCSAEYIEDDDSYMFKIVAEEGDTYVIGHVCESHMIAWGLVENTEEN